MLISLVHANLHKSDLEQESGSSPDATVSEKLNQISDLISSQSKGSETMAHNELSFATEDLLVYLNGHVYSSTSFTGYGGGFGLNSDEQTKNDIINRVKTEIRSVKGAVLNMYSPFSANV
jgi:hypothetical protein